MSYAYKKQVASGYQAAVAATREALAGEGFGVITEIDVQQTLKQKLGIEYPPYVILGACNPEFAHQAIEKEKDLGLLLPCNVLVYESDDAVFVAAVLPTKALNVADNPALMPIAQEVEKRIVRAVDAVAA